MPPRLAACRWGSCACRAMGIAFRTVCLYCTSVSLFGRMRRARPAETRRGRARPWGMLVPQPITRRNRAHPRSLYGRHDRHDAHRPRTGPGRRPARVARGHHREHRRPRDRKRPRAADRLVDGDPEKLAGDRRRAVRAPRGRRRLRRSARHRHDGLFGSRRKLRPGRLRRTRRLHWQPAAARRGRQRRRGQRVPCARSRRSAARRRVSLLRRPPAVRQPGD